ncbi:MAG TPA: hypothetical protein VFL57_18595 [Bryobacteraceae bacterium]|nr:hypothetical protein [Bryobacteraceae bacterium]
MRDAVIAGGLMLFVALLGGVVYFGFRPSLSGPRPAASTSEPAAVSAEQSEQKAARQNGTRRRTVAHRAATAAVEGLMETPLNIPNAPIPAAEQKLPPPFPSDRDLVRGMARSRLRVLYGPPSLRVSATRDGRLVERYVYMRPDRTSATIAHLENGAVVSAETVAQ